MTFEMPDTSNPAIGARLVRIREARGYLQGFLAQTLGVSQQRWSNYERGDRVLPHDLLYKFCQVTGATPDYVLFGSVRGLPMDLAMQMREGVLDEKRAGPGAKAG